LLPNINQTLKGNRFTGWGGDCLHRGTGPSKLPESKPRPQIRPPRKRGSGAPKYQQLSSTADSDTIFQEQLEIVLSIKSGASEAELKSDQSDNGRIDRPEEWR
jgi:hypothetical protein